MYGRRRRKQKSSKEKVAKSEEKEEDDECRLIASTDQVFSSHLRLQLETFFVTRILIVFTRFAKKSRQCPEKF